MRLRIIALMAGAGLMACSGGGDSGPVTDGPVVDNNIPSAGAAVVEEREFGAATSALTPPPTSARDPGPRTGTPGAGAPLPGLTTYQLAAFEAGKLDFEEVEEVEEGLGPTLNLDSCGGCHSQPAIGGTSPAVNPQVAFATKDGMRNTIPSFIRINGPVREARFVRNPDGTPDGGVHALFSIRGHRDAPDCQVRQPDFAGELSRRNVVFRIPTPVFGAGLIEAIPDSEIVRNAAAQATAKQSLGIRGRPNVVSAFSTISGSANKNGNDGTIARFGHKAQNKSLLIFSGEAYNVEMGISNGAFPTEREEAEGCHPSPVTLPNSDSGLDGRTPTTVLSSIDLFTFFMRFLAPPTPWTPPPGDAAASIARGRVAFNEVGCALCHTPSLQTYNATVVALRRQSVNLFSDLLLHDMGNGLADGVRQGQASGREFRSAPLWGLGQRLFFLHDGRTSDLKQAIYEHFSDGSEANGVVQRFVQRSDQTQQDILNFLRSL
jgi:CxxC motif-containing protein (DUF1111 family)